MVVIVVVIVVIIVVIVVIIVAIVVMIVVIVVMISWLSRGFKPHSGVTPAPPTNAGFGRTRHFHWTCVACQILPKVWRELPF